MWILSKWKSGATLPSCEWKLGVISPGWQETTIPSADLRELLPGLWKIVTEILHSLSQGSCVSILEDCWTQLFREPYIFSLTVHHSSDEDGREQGCSGRAWWFTQPLPTLVMGIKAGEISFWLWVLLIWAMAVLPKIYVKADFGELDNLKVVWEDDRLMNSMDEFHSQIWESVCDGSFRCLINLKFCG